MGIRALLIPSHFFERPTLAVDTFIDIVGQNWPRNAKLCTPLQQTVNTAGPTYEVATAVPDSVVQRKKPHLSHDKEAFSGNTVHTPRQPRVSSLFPFFLLLSRCRFFRVLLYH